MQTKNCLNCDKLIIRQPKNKHNWQLKKYCSNKCCKFYNYNNYRKIRKQRIGFRSKKISSACLWCEKNFNLMSGKHKYCCYSCRTKYHSYRISLKAFKRNSKKKCLFCKTIFNYTKQDQKFCSKKCSEKHNDYLRSSKKKGRPKEIAKRFALTIQDYELLKKNCVMCEWNYNINIHHIIPKSLGGTNSIENYLPLCPNCHKLIHSGYSLKEIKEIVKTYNGKTSVRIKKELNYKCKQSIK